MKKYVERIKQNSLFLKMFIVMVVSIVGVSAAITFASVQMSERLFINTFSITNTKMINQISTNFERYSDAGITVINQAQRSEVVKEYLTDRSTDNLTIINHYYQIKQWMDSYYDFFLNYDGVNIVVMGENGRLFSSNYINWPVSESLLRTHPITLNAYKNPNRIFYQYASEMSEKLTYVEPTVVISKALVERTSNHIYGIIYISIREKDFRQMYAEYTDDNRDIYLLDQMGQVVSSNQSSSSGVKSEQFLKRIKEIEAEELAYNQVRFDGRNYLLFLQYLPALDMYLMNLIDRDELKKELVDTKVISLISTGIVILAVRIVFFIYRRFTNSLSGLVREISHMSKSHFNAYVTESGSYEVRQLARTFNGMLDELHEYVEQLLEIQKKKRVAELEALQHQINPHFLYNTLASVKFLVQQKDVEKSSEMINALIVLLQNTIGTISETNTIRQEVEDLKNYVFINQMRYGDNIQVRYLVQPESLMCELPKLLIQPFVENAFFHGFNYKKEGQIQLLIYIKDEQLICEVVDNGDGMKVDSSVLSAPKNEARQFLSGIGIQNVRERIHLLYGKEYGVQVSSVVGEGTKIRICLPVIKSKESTRK